MNLLELGVLNSLYRIYRQVSYPFVEILLLSCSQFSQSALSTLNTRLPVPLLYLPWFLLDKSQPVRLLTSVTVLSWPVSDGGCSKTPGSVQELGNVRWDLVLLDLWPLLVSPSTIHVPQNETQHVQPHGTQGVPKSYMFSLSWRVNNPDLHVFTKTVTLSHSTITTSVCMFLSRSLIVKVVSRREITTRRRGDWCTTLHLPVRCRKTRRVQCKFGVGPTFPGNVAQLASRRFFTNWVLLLQFLTTMVLRFESTMEDSSCLDKHLPWYQ